MSRVVTTIFRTIMVNLAGVPIASRIESQPGASGQRFARIRVHPDITLADVSENFWPMVLPPVYF